MSELTRRQREVAVLVARGLSNAEIGERLVLTTGTVANHVEAIRKRLKLRTRAEVAAWAIEHGLTPTQDRLLTTLEHLLQLDATDSQTALSEAATVVGEALGADKVDVFLYDPTTDSLVALGTSATPLGRQEHALGLDRLPLVNGGLTVQTFQTRVAYVDGRADRNPRELPRIKRGLGVRSSMAVPLKVGKEHRGVLLACALAPDFFSERDLRFLQAVAHWVGTLAHRADLVHQIADGTAVQRRRVVEGT